MVIKSYWRFHRIWDVCISASLAIFLNHWASNHITGIQITPGEIREIGRDWVGVCLSIFGLIAATIAFMFTVIDMPQFKILKNSKSRAQFWGVFVFNLQVLLSASIWCALISVGSDVQLSSIIVWDISVFLAVLVTLELAKFTWLIGLVVGVRASHHE